MMSIANKVILDIYAALHTNTHIFIIGRALRRSSKGTYKDEGIIKSLLTTFQIALSREIKKIPLHLYIDGVQYSSTTDNEGYFEYSIPHAMTSRIELPDVKLVYLRDDKAQSLDLDLKSFKGDLLKGIISDIDDTVMLTHVRSFFKLRMILSTIFINPFKRKPIANAANFYHQYLSAVGTAEPPMIYISNSPWNMYYYLHAFLKHNDFPNGVLLLRDFGLQMLQKKKPLEIQNKYLLIVRMLMLFPTTKFILIGDSAEADFKIYMKIKNEYPDHIEKIIIRRAGNKRNESEMMQLLNSQNISYVRIIDSFDDMIVLDK